MVVFYRDGVSDGMLEVTQNYEIPQIASVFQGMENYDPNLYFIVVQKRINTRIFSIKV